MKFTLNVHARSHDGGHDHAGVDVRARVLVFSELSRKPSLETGPKVSEISGAPDAPLSNAPSGDDPWQETIKGGKWIVAGQWTQARSGRTDAQGRCSLVFDVETFARRILERGPNPEGRHFPVLIKPELSIEVDGLRRVLAFPQGAGPSTIGEDVARSETLWLDFAQMIVGATTRSNARIWLRRFGTIAPTDRYALRLTPSVSRTLPLTPHLAPIDVPITFDATREQTAVVDVGGLRPGTAYDAVLTLHATRTNANGGVSKSDPRSGRPSLLPLRPAQRLLATGSFSTDGDDQREVLLNFASCHHLRQTSDGENTLERWNALSASPTAQALILLGDQVYADGVRPDAAGSYRSSMVKLYTDAWRPSVIRNVLRRTPTYMMLDDHEIGDDYGTVLRPNNPSSRRRISDGLTAWHIFQNSHNPGDTEPLHSSGPFHFSFSRGPVAAFVLDVRSQRGLDADYPVMGRAQHEDLVRWAHSPAAEQADVILIVSPTPVAFVDVGMLERLKDAALKAAQVTATGLGAAIGSVGGPAGALVGAAAGYVGAELASDYLGYSGSEFRTKYDIDDCWSAPKNRPELGDVLRVAFDLANRNKPRLLLFVGGDVHLGALHMIHSRAHASQAVSTAYQVISSAISRSPAPDVVENMLKASIASPRSVSDAIKASLTGGVGRYFLDPSGEYIAELNGVIGDRNFGSLRIVRDTLRPRCYDVSFGVEGRARGLEYRLRVDLDAPFVEPTPFSIVNSRRH